MKKFTLTMVALAALGFSQPASAASWCTGTISVSWVDAGGSVLVTGSWRGTHTQICSVKTEWKSITPDVCANWMAKLDAALTLSRGVTVYYDETIDCAALPTYGAAPPPGYVMLH